MKTFLSFLFFSGALLAQTPTVVAPSYSTNVHVTVPGNMMQVPTMTVKVPPVNVTVPVNIPLTSLLPKSAVWVGADVTVPDTCNASNPTLFVLINPADATAQFEVCSTNGKYIPLILKSN